MSLAMDKSKSKRGLRYQTKLLYLTEVLFDISYHLFKNSASCVHKLIRTLVGRATMEQAALSVKLSF